MPRARKPSNALSGQPEGSWCSFPETCIICNKGDFEASGPRTLVICEACGALGVHVGCHEETSGEALDPTAEWYCCQVPNVHDAKGHGPAQRPR